jgi:hypothetical protein
MSHNVRLDCSLLKPETFVSKVRALEPAEQLIFCENVVVQCQNLQDQTTELLIATLDWIEEKNLSQHVGKRVTAYLRTLEERYPVVGTVAITRREKRIERAKEDIEKIWKASLEKSLGRLHPPTLSIQFVEGLRRIAKLCPNAVEATNEIESQVRNRASQPRSRNYSYAIQKDVSDAAKALRIRQRVKDQACSSNPEKRTYGLRSGTQLDEQDPSKSKRLRGERTGVDSHSTDGDTKKESSIHSPPTSSGLDQEGRSGGEGQSNNEDTERASAPKSPPTQLTLTPSPGPSQEERPGGEGQSNNGDTERASTPENPPTQLTLTPSPGPSQEERPGGEGQSNNGDAERASTPESSPTRLTSTTSPDPRQEERSGGEGQCSQEASRPGLSLWPTWWRQP